MHSPVSSALIRYPCANPILPIILRLCAALAVILFRRFSALWVRLITGLMIAAYVLVPAYFILTLGGS